MLVVCPANSNLWPQCDLWYFLHKQNLVSLSMARSLRWSCPWGWREQVTGDNSLTHPPTIKPYPSIRGMYIIVCNALYFMDCRCPDTDDMKWMISSGPGKCWSVSQILCSGAGHRICEISHTNHSFIPSWNRNMNQRHMSEGKHVSKTCTWYLNIKDFVTPRLLFYPITRGTAEL